MNNIIVEFQIKSQRTAPFKAQPANQQEYDWFMSNYTLGLVGETLELSKVLDKYKNINNLDDKERKDVRSDYIKEMGDVFHYAVNLLTAFGEEFKEERLDYGDPALIYLVGDFVESVKKSIYHGHVIEKSYFIESLYEILNKLIDYAGLDLQLILDANIEKLKERYPQCFTVEDSIARKDVK